LSYSQPVLTADTPIYYATYKAAASDMEVSVLKECQFVCESRVVGTNNPRVDFNQAFAPIHPSVTGYKHQGFFSLERNMPLLVKSYID